MDRYQSKALFSVLSLEHFEQDIETESLNPLGDLSGNCFMNFEQALETSGEKKTWILRTNMFELEKSLLFLLKRSSSSSFSTFTGRVFGGRRLWPLHLLRLSQRLTLP